VIDLFCGAGGASAGIGEALGRPVDLAVDSSPAALSIHADNHPWTRHVLADLTDLDPLSLSRPGDPDLIWASPPCVKGLSKFNAPKIYFHGPACFVR
jgi:DNA (cytosine-5)-methyltransferase 1